VLRQRFTHAGERSAVHVVGPPQRVSGAVDMPLRLNEVITPCGLSSDDSAYSSGSELLIDGGATAQ
jgi:hypothetical protein